MSDLDSAHMEPQDDVAISTLTSHKATLHPNFQPRMFKLSKLHDDSVDFRPCAFIYIYIRSFI